MSSPFWKDHLPCREATVKLSMLISSVDSVMLVLGQAPEIGAKDSRRLAGNSAAKAGGAEIESSIFTKRFPIEPFLA